MLKIIIILITLITIHLSLLTPVTYATDYTKEEYAVYNRCQFIAPGGVCPQPTPPSDTVLGQISGFLGFLTNYFWVKPQNVTKMEDQSQNKQAALVPEQITSPNAQNQTALIDTIGKPDGIYGLGMPDSAIPPVTNDNQGRGTECVYNNANFPDQVSVFTDNNLCPPSGKPTGQ